MRYEKLVQWDFNSELWSQEITRLTEEFGPDFVAGMIGVSKSCASNWAHGNYTGEFGWPSMKNFLSAVDNLDLDPRDFFIQRDA